MTELDDRREFERRLHDGVQQDLIALAVRLQLLRDLVPSDGDDVKQLLDELRADVHAAIDAVRSLATDVYPPTLEARGLAETLSDLEHVRFHNVGRHSTELEAAVYFCLRSTDATVDVYEHDGGLRLEVDGHLSSRFRTLAEAAGAVFYDSAR